MSELIKAKRSRQPRIYSFERHGIPFYMLSGEPGELWVAGVDISRSLSVSNPASHAYRTYKNNENWLKDESRVIKIPRKSNDLYPPEKGVQGDTQNREVRVYSETGFNFFVSISNTKKGKDHLLKILREYKDLKKALLSEQHGGDLEKLIYQFRQQGKVYRRKLTDTIKSFVEYAKEQGSTTPQFYYKNITQKVNKLLFDVNGKGTPNNFRDGLSPRQLLALKDVEEELSRFIEEAMNRELPYKEIYTLFDPIPESGKQLIESKLQYEIAW